MKKTCCACPIKGSHFYDCYGAQQLRHLETMFGPNREPDCLEVAWFRLTQWLHKWGML